MRAIFCNIPNSMSLDRTLQYVSAAVAIVLSCAFAILCGSLIGGGQFKLLGLIALGVVTIATIVLWRTGVWLLIPLCWELTGRLPFAGVPLSVRDIAVGVATVGFLVFYALKLLRSKPEFDLVDFFVLLNLGYLVTVYARNPVGVDWLGSTMVGGRPYFDIFIAFLAFSVLKRVPVDLGKVRLLPIFALAGAAFVSLGNLITLVWPSMATRLGMFYSTFAPPEYETGQIINEDVLGRRPLLGAVGVKGMQVLTSYFTPFSFLFPHHLIRFLAAIAFMTCVLFSGYRSGVLTVFVYIGLSSYFRKRKQDIAVFALAALIFVGFAAIGHGRLFQLPLAAQRALSFFPGNWDYEAASDARASSEWRYQMWNMVLVDDKWIRNKWLGDGFGFTRYELGIMQSPTGFVTGVGQEAFLIVGTYHSGPLSTIRYAGLVGLALFFPLMLLLTVRAYRLIRACHGTALFPVALFVGMPVVFAPLPFIFVAGGYDSNMAETFFAAGLLRVIDRARVKLLGTPDATGVAQGNGGELALPGGSRRALQSAPII